MGGGGGATSWSRPSTSSTSRSTATQLVAALRVRDRLDLQLAVRSPTSTGPSSGTTDGATSMTRWLVSECAMTDAAARRLVVTAARLAAWPVLAAALADGIVSAGQVEVVVTKVRPRHVAAFAAHEETSSRRWRCSTSTPR